MNKNIVVASVVCFVVGVIFFFYQFKLSNRISYTPIKIVALGDSLTAGYGLAPQDSYPSILESRLKEQYPNLTIVNLGVSGDTTADGLARINTVLEQSPSIVLLELGANDMLRSLPTADVEKNLETIIQTLQAQNIEVVLLGMESQMGQIFTYKKDFNAIFPRLAEKYNLPFVPYFLSGVALHPTLNISDGIHPNRAGYEKIVDENVLPVLLKVLN